MCFVLAVSSRYRNFTGLLSGLSVATQQEIDQASQFFAASRCYFPLNGSPTVAADEWMFYLARRAQAFQAQERGRSDGLTDTSSAAPAFMVSTPRHDNQAELKHTLGYSLSPPRHSSETLI